MAPDGLQHIGTGIGIGLGSVAAIIAAALKIWADRRKDGGGKVKYAECPVSRGELEQFCREQHEAYRVTLVSAMREAITTAMKEIEPLFDKIERRLARGDKDLALLAAEARHQGETIRELKAGMSKTYGAAHIVADRQGPG